MQLDLPFEAAGAAAEVRMLMSWRAALIRLGTVSVCAFSRLFYEFPRAPIGSNSYRGNQKVVDSNKDCLHLNYFDNIYLYGRKS